MVDEGYCIRNSLYKVALVFLTPFTLIPQEYLKIGYHHHHHHHAAVKDLGHMLSHSGLMHPEISSVVFLASFCLLGC